MAHPVLETRGLTIRFGGHVAVDGVSAAFHAGTLTAIVGPNGAGKTTYFNLISGQLPATAGHVLLDGVDITGAGAATRARRGIGRAFQLTNLFPNLSVHENVRLAVQARAGGGADILSRWSSRIDWIERADQFIEAANLADKRDIAAVALPHGDKRKLEVAIMMALAARVWCSTSRRRACRSTTCWSLTHQGAQGRSDKTILPSSTRWTWSRPSPTASSSTMSTGG
jgi:branched-chain amino acid transport system ATP-binding protein